MFALCSVLLVSSLAVLSCKCDTGKIRLEPESAILNATSTTRFVCRKEQDDSRGFQISLSPNITEQYSVDFMGVFTLLCSSESAHDSIARSDIIIGKAPGLLTRIRRCTVYFDEYIDCTIKAAVMIRAMANRLEHNFQFIERPLFSRPRVYRSNPKLIEIDYSRQTLTFRWLPNSAGYFPSRLQMNVSATIRYFGSSNYIMAMSPIFQISSNFTAINISATAVEVQFEHHNSSLLTICHGNITNEKKDPSDEEEIRTQDESNSTRIRISNLYPDTWYQLCFYCRRDVQFDTMSNLQCHRYRTLKSPKQLWPLIIKSMVICLAFVITGIICWKGCNWTWFRQKLQRVHHRRQPHTTVIDGTLNSAPLMLPEFVVEETPL